MYFKVTYKEDKTKRNLHTISQIKISYSALIENMLLVETLQKLIQISILIFLEAQEKKLLINLQGSKCNGYCVNFLWEFFSFYEKVHSLLDPAVLLKSPFSPKHFLEVNKGIERLPQNVLNVFQIPTQSKSSDGVFFNKIDHQNYVLWTWYFLE